ncbi:MAG: hypothetical protein ACLQF0_17045 [Dissulfurispiraceae bacterium]
MAAKSATELREAAKKLQEQAKRLMEQAALEDQKRALRIGNEVLKHEANGWKGFTMETLKALVKGDEKPGEGKEV